jgi:hypothetical protein
MGVWITDFLEIDAEIMASFDGTKWLSSPNIQRALSSVSLALREVKATSIAIDRDIVPAAVSGHSKLLRDPVSRCQLNRLTRGFFFCRIWKSAERRLGTEFSTQDRRIHPW